MIKKYWLLTLAVLLMPAITATAQVQKTLTHFVPVKVDGPPHDPANDSYWFGPFSETASVGDFDNDGDLDIAAARSWYEAPLWIEHENFRDGAEINGPETEVNSEFAMDVNFDGCVDIVASGWMFMKGAYWYENPCNKTDVWKSYRIHQAFNMEGVIHGDIDDDGDDDILVNHWSLVPGQGMTWIEHIDQEPWFVEHVVGTKGDMHGNGLGDINGDGRMDIVTPVGWYEQPEDISATPWPFHEDWEFEAWDNPAGSGSHPLIVADVNEDGLNDVIIGSAHAYGLAWYEQQLNGDERDFEKHWIETQHSELHTLALGDLNGDGREDLVAGKRIFSHYGDDVGAFDPLFGAWYDFNGGDIIRHVLFYNHLPYYPDEPTLNPPPNYAFGMGMKTNIADMNEDGRNDIVLAGKTGLYIFYNQGSPPKPRLEYELPSYATYETWKEWGEYEELFNGEDFTHWVVPEGDGGHWQIVNSVIDYDAQSEAEVKHLFTEEEFCDYNLHIEWRFKDTSGMYDMPTVLPDGSYKQDASGEVITTPTPNADSGILLRGEGHQVNIWNWPIGSGELWSVRNNEDLAPELRAAAVPMVHADRPIGEWNAYDITMIDDRVSVMLNGEQVIDNAQIPGIPECGPIGLQHHGGEGTMALIQFRNIWIDPIDAEQKQEILAAMAPDADVQPGWETLFNGDEEDLAGWIKGPDNAFVVQDGVLTVDREMDGAEHNADYLWTEETYGDFILELEFKTVENSNSGVFLRTSDIADPVYTGIEIQINNSYGAGEITRTGTTGAIYDLVEPEVNAVNPPGEWNKLRVVAVGNQIKTYLNGYPSAEMALDLWTTTGMNPDGTTNKFTRPLKDFARVGHIGLQDHGRPVWYRNIQIKRLEDGLMFTDN